MCVQHVVNAVEVEKSEIIEETVQRMKHIIQEKINQETKRIKIPPLQFTDKVVDNPVVAQRQIFMVLTVQNSIEISQLQVTNEVIDVHIVSVVQVPRVLWVVKKTVEDPQFVIVQKTVENPETVPQMQVVEKTTEIPQFRVADKVVDVPVVLVVEAPLVQVIVKTIQISQLPFIEKIAVIPEIRTVPGTQTSESLNTAFLRRVTQAEIGALAMSEHGWSAGMQRSTQQCDSNQAVASNNCKQHNKRERKKGKKGRGREMCWGGK